MAFIGVTLLTYTAAFVCLLCASVYLFFRHHYNYWRKRQIPFIKPRFIWGSIGDSMTLKRTMDEEMLDWYKESKSQGYKYYGIYFFHQPVLVFADPELVKNVLTKHFNNFFDRGGFVDEENDPLSAHLFALCGMKWKHLRQKLTPTFTSGKLKMMFQTLINCTEELQNCLDDYIAKAEPVDIKKIMTQYTVDVIGSCAFGLDCNSFKDPNSDFIRIGTGFFKPNSWDRFKIFFSFIFPDITKFFKMRITNKEVDHFFRKLVRDTIEYRENNNVTRNDFMHLLIQLKNKGVVEDDEEEVVDKVETVGTTLTVDQIAAQAFLFFGAGFETSSTTMTFTLYELAKNPEAQEKAREEIVKVLKVHDGKLSYQAMMDMYYLERCIFETLRKHPPVGGLQRIVTEEYTIPDTDIVLKKNFGVFIPVIGLHMDPEYYPDPEKFDPDRFTEENKATRPDYTFLPFGDGPRVCIGLRFAMMQVKVGICRLLLHYKFTLNSKTADPIVLEPASFLRTVKGGIWLDAHKITS